MKRTMLTAGTIEKIEERFILDDLVEEEETAIEDAAYIANTNASQHPEWTEEDIFNECIRIMALDGIELEEKPRKRAEIIDDIIEFFDENDDIFTDAIEELDNYNGYLGDDRWYNMENLPELLSINGVMGVLNMAFFGHDDDTWTTDSNGYKEYGSFNPNRNYFSFNGYGNLVSSDWKNYSDKNDRYAVEDMECYRCRIDAIDESDELSDLFDELENAED